MGGLKGIDQKQNAVRRKAADIHGITSSPGKQIMVGVKGTAQPRSVGPFSGG